ncbi:Terpenoid synthase [Penicillium digitatum]|uniref:Terpene synthase n=3 Tax=Penicillium digitatum TaxID=36651 RepID=K9GAM1_PEND2|nr:hypothetical protein PDIP_09590 [Penicillium digitatum Pd1]EKV18995.1 hypothetical protein PDIG_04920 [Penicillium digitatum PHI26]EKV21133.1 hypothetical protein PDIP_09590 [Penicillium digitatum Pd1]KAG0154032.1 hypothetical protein PDIDSM_1411 [Penicillium digitatum]QQK48234.1 Terpenoid synthase [Penicillium digitatum]
MDYVTASLRALFEGLDGHELIIPSRAETNPGWEVTEHDLSNKSIKAELTSWVESWWSDGPNPAMIEALNLPNWVALLYPNVKYEKRLTIAKSLSWIFAWDEPLDDGEFTHDPVGAINYCNETIKFMELLRDPSQVSSACHPNPNIASFKDSFVSIWESHPVCTGRYLDECLRFVQGTSEAVGRREKNQVPTLADYFDWRVLNLGFEIYFTLVEYSQDLKVPDECSKPNVFTQIIFREASLILSVYNDLLSLPKELDAGQFESCVPIKMFELGLSLDETINSFGQMIHECAKRFNKAEQDLYSHTSPDSLADVQAFVQGIKQQVVGTNKHFYSMDRYVRKGVNQPDGSIKFKIALEQ